MTEKSKIVNTRSHNHYLIRPKIHDQHYHGNGYNNAHTQILSHKVQNPLKSNDQLTN
jgi:hypothetical protein